MRTATRRSNHATVVAYAALVFAMGGTATATTYVVSANSQLGPGTVSGASPTSGKHANLIHGTIGAPDLHAGSVTGAKIAANAIATSKVADHSLRLADVAAWAVTMTVPGATIPSTSCDSITPSNLRSFGARDGDRVVVVPPKSSLVGMVYPNATADGYRDPQGNPRVEAVLSLCNVTGSYLAVPDTTLTLIGLR